MIKRLSISATLSIVLTMAACGGDVTPGNDAVDDVPVAGDTAGQDSGTTPDADERDANVPVDTNTPPDIQTGDTQAGDTHTGDADAVAGDTGDAIEPFDASKDADNGDTGELDVPVENDAAGDAEPPVDIHLPGCEGDCTYGTDSMWCAEDGLTVCYCGEDGQWLPVVCATACENSNMVGDQCITDGAEQYCKCEYDCTDSDAVTAQCDDFEYTPCTCAEADPCKWSGDGWCDKVCEINFPDDFFREPFDCKCDGTCDPDELAGFCDNDGGTCICDIEGNLSSVECGAFCTSLDGQLIEDDWCYMDDYDFPHCNCELFKCDNSEKVQAQCDAFVPTECTCAVADPCGWTEPDDRFCDTPLCREMFPELEVLDDTGTAACTQPE